jgi:hypothetical protein
LFIDDYSITIRNVPAGTYIKEVAYGGRSILQGTLRPGSAIGNAGLKIVLARDGGTVSVRAADSDGKPVGDSYVLLVPADTPSEGALSDTMISSQTDQNGRWTSTSLAPGKYYVMGLRAPEDRTPETLARLWAARTGAQEVELGSNAHQQVTVEPK